MTRPATDAPALDDAPGWRFLTDRRALAFVGVLTALRLLHAWLADLELYGDEAQYWVWSRDLAGGYFSKPPLLAWLIRLTTALGGSSEFAVRLASPLLHAGTALVLGVTACRLGGRRAGRYAAALYATVPAVSLSSLLISTDVPLLFLWSVALDAWMVLLRRGDLRSAWVLGLACGLGLLAKYAMVYFWLAAPLSLWRARPLRPGVRRGAALALGLSLACLAPNLLWNASHGFLTFRHTAVNAGAHAIDPRPGRMLEFLWSQAGVLGPVLFAIWIGVLVRGRRGAPDPARPLRPFEWLPILVVLPVALVRGANANWAATAFPAICVHCALLADSSRGRRWLGGAVVSSLALVALAFAVGPLASALGHPLPGHLDPWKRLRGGRRLGVGVERVLAREPGLRLLCDDRMTLARLAYYLPAEREHPWSWAPHGTVQHHFDLVWPLSAGCEEPYLFVTRRDDVPELRAAWREVRPLPDLSVPTARDTSDVFHLYRVQGARAR